MNKQFEPNGDFRVTLSPEEVADLRDHTLVDPDYLSAGIVDKKGRVCFTWSLETFEDLLGHLAASANHCKSRSIEKRLNALYFRLDELFKELGGE